MPSSRDSKDKNKGNVYKGLRQEIGLSATVQAKAALEKSEQDKVDSNIRLHQIAKEKEKRRNEKERQKSQEAEENKNRAINEAESLIAELSEKIANTHARISEEKNKMGEAVSEMAKLAQLFPPGQRTAYYNKKVQELRRYADTANTMMRTLGKEVTDLEENLALNIEKREEILSDMSGDTTDVK